MPLLSLPQEIIVLIVSKLALARDILNFLQVNHFSYNLLLHELCKRDIRVTGGLALSFYALWGYDARVRDMLALGADVDIQNPRWRDRTPLMLAISRHEIAVVRTLIENGANLNFTKGVKNGPLDIAILNTCQYGVYQDGLSLIELLLNSEADINLRGYQDRTPLYTAIVSQSPAIVAMLLARGADIHVREEKHQRTPLHFAAGEDGPSEIVKILLDAGSEIDSRDGNDMTPLQIAVSRAPKHVQTLIDYGADGASHIVRN
ncbi:hypothetical protein DTO166G4_5456 [Paecilomyces variotii]|nr:hypothetical protein DTO166G4_5456 [Paecilomyces variotii]KAJ9236129.1 hypothetical protein DTO166G5_4174 [Paecilomyces variotii]